MIRGWKAAMIGLAVLGLAGLVGVWRWQMLAAEESLIQAAGVPVVLLLAGVLVIWGAGRAWARLQPSAGQGTEGHGTSARAAVAPAGAQQCAAPTPTCPGAAVLDGALCLSAGMVGAQVLSAVTQKAVWPQLDESLCDVEGNPVFTARVPTLTVPAQEILSLATSPTRVLRARGALQRVWQPMCVRLEASLAGLPPPPRSSAAEHGVPLLQIVVLLPADWPEQERGQTLEDLRQQAQALQASTRGRLEWTWELLPSALLGEPEGLWTWVDDRVQAWATGARPVSLVLLAADSGLDDESIEQRQARGELFTAIHQQGRIPGEGAAALWLGSQSWVRELTTADHALVCLHQPVMARRDKSADAAGEVGHATLEAGLGVALSRLDAGMPLLAVVSDADHRASRTVELVQSLAAAAPGLETSTALCRLGDACGDLGVVGPLAPVAVAAGALRERLARPGATPRAALAVCVQSPLQRVVVPLGAWPREGLAA